MKRTIHVMISNVETENSIGIKLSGNDVIARVCRAINCEIHYNGTTMERLATAIEHLPEEVYFSPAVKIDLGCVISERYSPDETIVVHDTKTERYVQIDLEQDGRQACATVYDLPKNGKPHVLAESRFCASSTFFPMKPYSSMEV